MDEYLYYYNTTKHQKSQYPILKKINISQRQLTPNARWAIERMLKQFDSFDEN